MFGPAEAPLVRAGAVPPASPPAALHASQVAGTGATRVTAYACYALGALWVIYATSVVDRQIIAILANDIKRDLHLDDASLGFLYGTAFAVFYAIFGIPLGRLADNMHRGKLLAGGLAAWSIMTVLSGFATSFAVLATARIGVGIGEAASAPASYSLISDYFPKSARATAMSIYASGLYFGFGLSLLIGGFVSSRWNAAFPSVGGSPLGLVGWQAAFVAVGLPGLAIALWALSLREPERPPLPAGDGEQRAGYEFAQDLIAILPPLTLLSAARYPGGLRANLILLLGVTVCAGAFAVATRDIAQWVACAVAVYAVASWVDTLKHRDMATYRAIWSNRDVLRLVASFGSIAFVTFATTFWAPIYALRTFYAGATASGTYLRTLTAAEEVGLLVGAVSAVASGTGVILGGILADWWKLHHPAGRIYLTMLSIVLAAPVFAYMFTTRSPGAFFVAVPIAAAIASAWTGAAVATIQDLVVPRMRASAGAAFILGITIVGLALGPYCAGKVATIAGNLRLGILSVYWISPFTLWALWRAAATIERAEAKTSTSPPPSAVLSEKHHA